MIDRFARRDPALETPGSFPASANWFRFLCSVPRYGLLLLQLQVSIRYTPAVADAAAGFLAALAGDEREHAGSVIDHLWLGAQAGYCIWTK